MKFCERCYEFTTNDINDICDDCIDDLDDNNPFEGLVGDEDDSRS